MSVRKQGILAVLDANVIVYLSECNISELEIVAQELIATFGILKIWVPQEVKEEVFEWQMQYILNSVGTIIPFETCPIKDKRFRKQIEDICRIHTGEADCIMQVYKVSLLGSKDRHKLKVYYLEPRMITNDVKVFRCPYVDGNYIAWKEIAQYLNYAFSINLRF